MWKKSKPADQPVSSSNQRASDQSSGAEDTQLSGKNGVDSTVSSVALDLLALGVHPSAEVAGGLSDAEMMLRVKAGDDSAFDYLVQKYRRPIISFMYRMAHNSAAAEDLAQEVFLRVYRSRAGYEPSANCD
jgi:RNA polymerase sigma-70 factor, ECF subfamily